MKIKNYLIILLIIVNSLTTLSQNTSNKINNNLSQCTYTVVGYLQSETNPQYQPVQDNSQWHYIAVTKNGLNGKIYLDGNLISNSTYANNPYIWNSLLLGATQGCIACAPSSNYVGQIDDLRISNIERTATQIANYYNSNQPFNADSNTIGIYNFDVPNGSILQSTGIGNNGVLYGGANYIQGKFGQALNLDGIDDYARITQSLPTNNITIEFWFKSSDTSASMAMLEYAYNTGIYLTSNTCPTEAPTGNSTQIFCATPTPTISQLTATGTNLQWYTTANGGSPLSSTSTLNDGTTYFASQTLNGIESTDRLAVTVDINDPQITASAATICSGTAVTLTASTPATPIANNCTLPTNLQNGLVGYWPFCGNADDVSGNGNNGTVNGATLTTDRHGNTNNAYSFDGVDDLINTNYTSKPLNGTISLWIKPINNSNIIQGSDSCGDFLFYTIDSKPALWIKSNDCLSSPNNFLISNQQINSNWNHLVFTWGNLGRKIYINGNLTISNNINYSSSSNLPLTFGGGFYNNGIGGNSNFFNGVLDDIVLHNRALTPQEISQLYNQGQTTYLWSTGETTATINPTPTATTTYWCDVTVNGVTCRKDVTITVNPIPLTPTGNTTQIFCATPAPTVAQLTATGTNIQWYAAATGGSPLASTTALIDGTTYYASQTINGCESPSRLAITVDFNDPQITASATTVCSGTAVTLTASTPALPITNNCTLLTNLQTGLVGYWPFCGNADDESGNGNNGTVNGATLTTDRFGNANNAYSFDGNSHYIEVPSNSDLRISNSYSITAWIYVDNWSYFSPIDEHAIVSKIDDGNWYGGYEIYSGGNGFILHTGNIGSNFQVSSGGYSINNWYFITVTFDGSNIKLYINGTLVNSLNRSGSLQTSNTPLRFGRRGGAGNFNNWFDGKIDDIGIWNRTLTQLEIQQLFTPATSYLWSTGATTPTISPTPIATTTYWCDVTVNGVTCRKEITINVNSTTPVPTGDATQVFCVSPAPTVADLTATGSNIQWYDTTSGGNLLSSTTALVDGTTYYASQTITNCESDSRLAVTVSFNDSQITASATTVCSGTAVTLTASTPATPITNNCTLPTNLQNGLVGYWPFCGNADDASGNGNNGTVNGATLTTDRYGNTNNAYSFDGVDDYIETNPSFTGQDFSFTAWVKLTDIISGNYLISNLGSSPTFQGRELRIDGETVTSVIGLQNSWLHTQTSNLIQPNTWYFLNLIVEGNLLKIYKDNQQVAQANIQLINSGVQTYRFGTRDISPLGGQLNGIIDDVTIFNRALNQSEITQLYNAGQTTYLWSTGETTATINPSPTATTNYWCDVTVNGVTCRKEITINVNSTTPAPTGDATQVFCVSPAPTVADLTATGSNIQWYDSLTGGNLLSNTTILVDGSNYYASQIINNCESTDRLAVTVDFNDPQITASATTICSDTAVSLSVNYMPSTNVLIDRVDLFEYSYNFISNWMNNIGGWTSGLSPFAYDLDNQPIGNLLRANSIWPIGTTMYIRKQVNLSNYDLNSITYKVAVDNGFKLYVNGNLVANENIGGYTYLWEYQGNIPSNYLNNGNNIFAFELIDDGASNVFASKIEGNFINNINLLWSTGETTSTINPNPTTTNTYWCDVTINGVTCRKEITINVNPNITPTFTQVVAICSGATLTALPTTSNNGITGTWSPALNNSATTTYTFTPDAGQCSTTATMTITVNPNITPTFTQIAAICSGASLGALPTTSNNGITGTWSPALNNSGTTTYTFTPDAGQCATTATMTITVNPNITPTFTQVAAICSEATLTALPNTSNNGITGTWSPALDNTATTTYTFTPTAGQCATTATMTITVNPNITPTFTQVAAICSGTTLSTLPTTSNNGITGTWSPALNNTATTTYTFTPDAGQCATTATMTITVNPNITPTFTQIAAICSGATLSALPTTSNNGITGTWSPALNNNTTTTYTFTPTAGQCATIATMTITVNLNITPLFAQVAAICSGATLTALPTTSNNGITGTWSPALNNSATTTYTFTPTAGQCATTATMTITVNPLPNEPTGNNQPMFCAIDNPTINDLVLNTNNIHWYLNATGGNILANNYLLTDGQILYAAAYDAITLCESNTRYQVIVSVENPTLPILGTIIEFCKELNATVSAIDTQGVSMVWYDSPTGNTTIPLDYILQDGDVLYGAALNTSTNCESTERVMIQISILDTALDYYNLITIDDNQRNTALKIIGIERFASNSIEIYNRYGTLVWSAINYDNSINAFKGMANVSGVVSKNSYLPSGTYFFILKYPNSCKQTELKGYIHLENKK